MSQDNEKEVKDLEKALELTEDCGGECNEMIKDKLFKEKYIAEIKSINGQ